MTIQLKASAMSHRKLKRTFELVRARRFVALVKMRAWVPGGWIKLPLDVDMRDVMFWMRRVGHR